ncbi:chemotaxis protein CheW [Thermosediminibacter litoriperuensis]|uniref:Chemotaxis protein CheW n=1 Tax=Thermosediminibacter litoriperuensis TaxID=291989 RepID=A0A5S5AQ64_9FIRM|nr:chemotaxis protein CheW [Thermosediminibacter litoriperuensis]TYP53787.1 purine-binding chemotaxis protein CheW [Thermosediminibacter litoriperuensis]
MRQIVVFGLGEELYGIDIFDLQEIIRMVEITHIPRAPHFIEGVINLRGRIIPIIDLKKRFGLADGEITKDSRIIVVNIDDAVAGLIVDHVTEVAALKEEDLEKPPEALTIDARFIQGLAKMGDRIVILIKTSEILNVTEKHQLKYFSKEDTYEEAERT